MSDEPVETPPHLLQLTVTVFPPEDGVMTAYVHMGHHELAQIQGTDLRDLMAAAGRSLTRAV